ncbi:hypothetical protein FRC02_012117 [Tulasnella sp. 418]|nr:hypothetical protein FRC02_012117 [Tulasnella sp. 418]
MQSSRRETPQRRGEFSQRPNPQAEPITPTGFADTSFSIEGEDDQGSANYQGNEETRSNRSVSPEYGMGSGTNPDNPYLLRPVDQATDQRASAKEQDSTSLLRNVRNLLEALSFRLERDERKLLKTVENTKEGMQFVIKTMSGEIGAEEMEAGIEEFRGSPRSSLGLPVSPEVQRTRRDAKDEGVEATPTPRRPLGGQESRPSSRNQNISGGIADEGSSLHRTRPIPPSNHTGERLGTPFVMAPILSSQRRGHVVTDNPSRGYGYEGAIGRTKVTVPPETARPTPQVTIASDEITHQREGSIPRNWEFFHGGTQRRTGYNQAPTTRPVQSERTLPQQWQGSVGGNPTYPTGTQPMAPPFTSTQGGSIRHGVTQATGNWGTNRSAGHNGQPSSTTPRPRFASTQAANPTPRPRFASEALANPIPLPRRQHLDNIDEIIEEGRIDSKRFTGMSTSGVDSQLIKIGKPTKPSTYGGESDYQLLERWIISNIRYFRYLNMLGEEYFTQQVASIGQLLTGSAADWFNHHVERGPKPIEQWSPYDVYQGLKARFLRTIDIEEAAAQFDKARQGTKDVEEFFNELLDLASRRMERPDEYTMRRRFFDGLNKPLQIAMAKAGVTTSTHSLDTMLQAARAQQDAARYAEAARSQKDPEASGNTSKQKSRAADVWTTPPQKFVRHTNHNWKGTTPTHKVVKKDPGRQEPPGKATNPSTSMPSGSQQQAKRGHSQAHAYAQGKHGDVVCFKCGKKGHYAKNCTGAPTRAYLLQMGEVSEEDPDESQEEDPPEKEDPEVYAMEGQFPEEDEESGDDEIDASGFGYWYDPEITASYAIRVTRDDSESTPVQSMALKARAPPTAGELLFIGNASRRVPKQPTREHRAQTPITALISVGKIKAYALLDSGSNTDIIAGHFVDAAGLKTFPLEKPLKLQMACTGSKAALSRGIYLDLKGPGIDETRFFDVANIEGYDMILGTPFLKKHSALLNFSKDPPSLEMKGEQSRRVKDDARDE